MTFTEIVRYIADRFNLKSDEQLARVATEINLRHREILSSLGVSQATEQTTASATTTISSRYLTFGPSPVAVVKILAVYNTALGTYPPPILDEVSPDELLSMGVVGDPPTHYAVTNMGERTVTIKLNAIPATAYALTADVEGNATQLSGSLSPAFSEDYHDILVNMVSADELEKAEKYDKAAAKLKQAAERMGAFKLFIAKSAYKDMVQGSRSSSSGGAGGGGGTTVSGWPAITTPNLPMAVGDLLVATATTAVGSLADVAVGQVLLSGGVGAAPVWGIAPATAGGTGQTSYAVGDLLYASTTTALSKLADVATGSVLVSGGAGVAPAYSATPTLTTVTLARPAIALVSTDGAVVQNPTAATSGATVQMSPRVGWLGHVWNTAADETSYFFAENLPATAATPTATWKLGYSRNGGAASYPLQVNSSGLLTVGGHLAMGTGFAIFFGSRAVALSPADGVFTVANQALTIGANLKADAIPTVASGFGGSPSVTAGSTPFAGSVNVGTGGVATSGVINFNGTAFPSAPFVVCMNTTTGAVVRATATTTQLTITAPAAFTASDVIAWICVSSK